MECSIGATLVSSEKLLIVNHLMFALVFNLTMCVLNDSFLFNSLSRNSNNSKFTATNTGKIAFCTYLIYSRSFSFSSYVYSFSLFIFFLILEMVTGKFISLNVRGISNFRKRKTIFTWCIKQKGDVIFLQERIGAPLFSVY